MIVTDPARFLAEFSDERYPPCHAATARGAFLIAPASNAFAVESASDNRYMDLSHAPDLVRAQRQHAELARRLADDVPVITFPGNARHPDGMFANNVFATKPGTLIIGRMRHAVRQQESDRPDIRNFFRNLLGYRSIDLSRQTFVAELTGAMVIDRARGIGYCGLSERCDLAGARAMHAAFGLRLTFAFALAPGEYHTNVVLALLAGRAVMLAADGFADASVADAIARTYRGCVIALDATQKNAFAGNALALAPERIWMSSAAAASLRPAQLESLETAGFAVGAVDLTEIERAGGSLRCCVAEMF